MYTVDSGTVPEYSLFDLWQHDVPHSIILLLDSIKYHCTRITLLLDSTTNHAQELRCHVPRTNYDAGDSTMYYVHELRCPWTVRCTRITLLLDETMYHVQELRCSLTVRCTTYTNYTALEQCDLPRTGLRCSWTVRCTTYTNTYLNLFGYVQLSKWNSVLPVRSWLVMLSSTRLQQSTNKVLWLTQTCHSRPMSTTLRPSATSTSDNWLRLTFDAEHIVVFAMIHCPLPVQHCITFKFCTLAHVIAPVFLSQMCSTVASLLACCTSFCCTLSSTDLRHSDVDCITLLTAWFLLRLPCRLGLFRHSYLPITPYH